MPRNTELHQVIRGSKTCIGGQGMSAFVITTGKGVVYVVGEATRLAAVTKFQEALPGAVIASIVQADHVL